jgi:hypothetical protein
MTSRLIRPAAAPPAIPALPVITRPDHPYPLASVRFAAPKDRQKVRLP